MGQRRISHRRGGDAGEAVFGCGGMTFQKIHFTFKSLIPWLAYASTGVLFFFGVAHHTLNFWERPGWQMLLLMLLGSPLFVFALKLMANKMRPHVSATSKGRLILFGFLVLAVSSFISWRIHRLPEAFQTVRVTSLNGEVRLLEVKGNYEVIPLYKAAGESNWQESEEKSYQATPDSSPIILHFKAPPYKPVTVLFLTSPQGGAAQVKLNHQRVQAAELYSQQSGQHRVRMVSDYRGIPGGLFAGMLILADMLTFGLLAFGLLVLQEIGQKNPIKAQKKRNWMRTDILILLAVGIALHTINILATPLTLNADSPAYLQGAVHLVSEGNFKGASTSVGPGMSLLLAPMFFLFGNNPWGIKILLHGIALACIPASYWLGWQLSKSRLVAFVSGLVIGNMPDLFFYSNTPMSDLPNLFFVLLFCGLLFSAIQTLSPWQIFLSMFVAGFAAIIRSENILLVPIGALGLIFSAFFKRFILSPSQRKILFFTIGIATVIAILPTFWWSSHNFKNHGFFGMSNYMGVVLYDGWVYYGDASNWDFSDQDSAALQELRTVTRDFPPNTTDPKSVSTGWEIFYSLRAAGYESNQSMDLLKTAALDSIKKDPRQTLELLLLKYRKGLQVGLPHLATYPLPSEPGWGIKVDNEYFQADLLSLPAFIQAQREIHPMWVAFYKMMYPGWIILNLLALSFSLVRLPAPEWVALIAITASRIFIPLTISVDFWRYPLAGWLPLQIIAIAWLAVVLRGISILTNSKESAPELKKQT
jgi:hypothetical protein